MMTYLFPFLLYTGVIGGIALLALELFPRWHPLRKPVAAAWITLLTLLWMTLPHEGRWVLSIWSPTPVLDGQLLIDITPAIWWCGLALGLALSGAAWVEIAERRYTLPLSGALVVAGLLTAWIALGSGSLLTTLASWTTFDLLWGIAGLMSGGEGERITLGLTIHGITSLMLWTVFLLLERAGVSVLWWLMWPTTSTLTLLLLAALLRMGLYPFHIVFPKHTSTTPTLTILYLTGVILGASLMYRMLALPSAVTLSWPIWGGILSLLWGGVIAWTQRGQKAILWSGYGLLGVILAGAMVDTNAPLLLQGIAVWISALSLIIIIRGQDQDTVVWTWPTLIALFFLGGLAPSAIGALFTTSIDNLGWIARLLIILGSVFVYASILHYIKQKAIGKITPPWAWQQVCTIIGYMLPILALVGISIVYPALVEPDTFSWLGLGLWLLTIGGAGALTLQGTRYYRTHKRRHRLSERITPYLDILDLQWFYHALWRGAEHFLGVLHVAAEVFEGSGALLWSFLILMLIVLMVVN